MPKQTPEELKKKLESVGKKKPEEKKEEKKPAKKEEISLARKMGMLKGYTGGR